MLEIGSKMVNFWKQIDEFFEKTGNYLEIFLETLAVRLARVRACVTPLATAAHDIELLTNLARRLLCRNPRPTVPQVNEI